MQEICIFVAVASILIDIYIFIYIFIFIFQFLLYTLKFLTDEFS